MQLVYFIYGSHDSVDLDIAVMYQNMSVFKPDQIHKIEREIKLQLIDDLDCKKDIDVNLFSVADGKVTWCSKGTPDEFNNMLLCHYGLHKQVHDLPIIEKVERNIGVKIYRTLRGLLSYFSRGKNRVEVKKLLHKMGQGEDLNNCLDTIAFLSTVDVNDELEGFYQKGSHEDVFKFFCVQCIQLIALLDGDELFTKQDYCKYFDNNEFIVEMISRNHISDPMIYTATIDILIEMVCERCQTYLSR